MVQGGDCARRWINWAARHGQPPPVSQMCWSCCLPPDFAAPPAATQGPLANTSTHDRQGDQREQGRRPGSHPTCQRSKIPAESVGNSQAAHAAQGQLTTSIVAQGHTGSRSRAGNRRGNPPETAPWPHPQTALLSRHGLALDEKLSVLSRNTSCTWSTCQPRSGPQRTP